MRNDILRCIALADDVIVEQWQEALPIDGVEGFLGVQPMARRQPVHRHQHHQVRWQRPKPQGAEPAPEPVRVLAYHPGHDSHPDRQPANPNQQRHQRGRTAQQQRGQAKHRDQPPQSVHHGMPEQPIAAARRQNHQDTEWHHRHATGDQHHGLHQRRPARTGQLEQEVRNLTGPRREIRRAECEIERHQHEAEHARGIKDQKSPQRFARPPPRHAHQATVARGEDRDAECRTAGLCHHVIECDRAWWKIKLRVFHRQHEHNAYDKCQQKRDRTGAASRCQCRGRQEAQRDQHRQIAHPVGPLIGSVIDPDRQSAEEFGPCLVGVERHVMQAHRPNHGTGVCYQQRVRQQPGQESLLTRHDLSGPRPPPRYRPRRASAAPRSRRSPVR